jgi:hypothetical protein
MIFTTLGLSLSNALRGSGKTPAPAPEPGPPKPEPSIPDRVKEGSKKLAEWFKKK